MSGQLDISTLTGADIKLGDDIPPEMHFFLGDSFVGGSAGQPPAMKQENIVDAFLAKLDGLPAVKRTHGVNAAPTLTKG